MNFSLFLYQELLEAYYKARVGGKRKTKDEHSFEINDIENILRLRDAIIKREYHPSRGVAFIIHDPVIREVFAAPFVDRIVHHFLFKYTNDWWEPRLINSAYSCRKGKGTIFGIKDLQRKIRRVSENGTKNAVVIKRDISGYFMSLDHSRLFRRICWGLDRQFPNGGMLYRTLKYLWHEIIFDNPTQNVRIHGKKTDWDSLPADKSLFYQPAGRGIVIGNLTSQLLSNIYLDQLDRYITMTLKYSNYGRYVDDFFIVIVKEELPQLQKDLIKIELYAEKLGLTIHPRKKYIMPAYQGIDFLGAKVFWDHILPGKRISHNFASQAYYLATEGQGKIESIASYDGLLSNFDSHKLGKKIYDNLGWDYQYPKLKKQKK